MIVCSCAVISDHDIELALVDIMSQPNAPIPTPGVVYRHLSKKLNCCGCVPLTVEIIYAKMEELEAKGLVCPCALRHRPRQAAANRPPFVRAEIGRGGRFPPPFQRHSTRRREPA